MFSWLQSLTLPWILTSSTHQWLVAPVFPPLFMSTCTKLCFHFLPANIETLVHTSVWSWVTILCFPSHLLLLFLQYIWTYVCHAHSFIIFSFIFCFSHYFPLSVDLNSLRGKCLLLTSYKEVFRWMFILKFQSQNLRLYKCLSYEVSGFQNSWALGIL